jgi:hypothetical protein
MEAPHSMVYRADLKRLLVVDGDASEIKVYDTNSYALVGHVPLYIDADSQAYDPETKLMYVIGGGREGSGRQGCESSKVKVLVPSIACIRTASISGACRGNEARSARM